jgi:hypothetical protein
LSVADLNQLVAKFSQLDNLVELEFEALGEALHNHKGEVLLMFLGMTATGGNVLGRDGHHGHFLLVGLPELCLGADHEAADELVVFEGLVGVGGFEIGTELGASFEDDFVLILAVGAFVEEVIVAGAVVLGDGEGVDRCAEEAGLLGGVVVVIEELAYFAGPHSEVELYFLLSNKVHEISINCKIPTTHACTLDRHGQKWIQEQHQSSRGAEACLRWEEKIRP